jgi:hypothetical protein
MRVRIYKFKECILIVLWLYICPTSIFAQAAPGTLRGQVTDPSGAVISQASVTARSSAGQETIVTTDAQGSYEIKGLSPGQYSLEAIAKGFARFQSDLIISTGSLEQLDIQLATPVQQDDDDVEARGTGLDLAPTGGDNAIVFKRQSKEALSEDAQLRSAITTAMGFAGRRKVL